MCLVIVFGVRSTVLAPIQSQEHSLFIRWEIVFRLTDRNVHTCGPFDEVSPIDTHVWMPRFQPALRSEISSSLVRMLANNSDVRNKTRKTCYTITLLPVRAHLSRGHLLIYDAWHRKQIAYASTERPSSNQRLSDPPPSNGARTSLPGQNCPARVPLARIQNIRQSPHRTTSAGWFAPFMPN